MGKLYKNKTSITKKYGEFEKLVEHTIPSVSVSGIRRDEMNLRLKVAGIPEEKMNVYDSVNELIESFQQEPTEKIYVMATYTGVLNLRKVLADRGYIKERMK